MAEAGIDYEESTKESQVRKLHKGRADLAIIGLLTGKELIKRLYPNEVDSFQVLSKPFLELPSSICFYKAYPQVEQYTQKFIQGFTKIKRNGTYIKIMEKYYGKESIPKEYHSLFIDQGKSLVIDFATYKK